MNQEIKRHLISAGITFVATFLLFFCTAIMDTSFVFNRITLLSAIMGALVTGVRALAKVIYELAASVLNEESEK